MRLVLGAALVAFAFVGGADSPLAGNCCAPAVPQQGVTGETAVLPHSLDIGLHYEYLRSRGYYDGGSQVSDQIDRKTDFKRATLTIGYGLSRRLSITAIVPYVWKENSRYKTAAGLERLIYESDGIGDLTGLVRFSAIRRDFISFRELSFAIGLKCPTGSVDEESDLGPLPRDVQPGTGTWDGLASFSFYQGYEPVDVFVSATYVMTTTYTDDRDRTSRFGNQFSLLTTANFHLNDRLDLSAALSGSIRGRDLDDNEEVDNTGRSQLWLVPGFQYAIFKALRVQAFFEYPIYQHFNGVQLGSDYNLRLSLAYSIPLAGGEED
ncbi:MAG: transporter [bacterium]